MEKNSIPKRKISAAIRINGKRGERAREKTQCGENSVMWSTRMRPRVANFFLEQPLKYSKITEILAKPLQIFDLEFIAVNESLIENMIKFN